MSKIIPPMTLILVLLVTFNFTLAQSSDFTPPTIVNIDYLPVGGNYFALSDDADYIYACNISADIDSNCELYDRELTTLATSLPAVLPDRVWSPDNGQLIWFDNTECNGEFDAVAFNTVTQDITPFCSPLEGSRLYWSPIDPRLALVRGDYLFDITTNQLIAYTPIKAFTEDELSHFLGYQDYFWDTVTDLPVAVLHLHQETNAQRQILASALQACPLGNEVGCITIVDTLDYSNADVSITIIIDKWLLWGGHLSNTGEALSVGINETLWNDTVFYLTDFQTRVTHEVFRFSTFEQPGLHIINVAWSPDRNMLGLAVRKSEGGLPSPNALIPFENGMLVLKLDWSSTLP